MTTVVSRLFADEAEARLAAQALRLQNIPDANIDVIPASNSAREALIDARVPTSSAEKYAEALQAGQAVLVARVGFNPRGAALSVMATMGEFETLDAGVENENVYIREAVNRELYMHTKIDRAHRRWLSR